MGATDVYSLNVHASYGCRHSGACCNAGWSIPVETHARKLLGTAWLVPGADGACPQFHRPSGLCRVHRDHGEAMLPRSCHHFPRRALVDERGTFVTLSHFCPTAASLLLQDEGPLVIVANPPAFPGTRDYEGLDATGEWPPLVRPDVLFDYESFDAWERYLVTAPGSSDADVMTTLTRMASTAHSLRQWTPARGTLIEWTGTLLTADRTTGDDDSSAVYEPFTGVSAYMRACATVPAGLVAPVLPARLDESDAQWVAPAWNRHARYVLRYLGAKAFASWTAYQSRGIRTQVAELFMTAAVLRVECVKACERAGAILDSTRLHDAIRASDWLLVHLADREALMDWLGEAEA